MNKQDITKWVRRVTEQGLSITTEKCLAVTIERCFSDLQPRWVSVDDSYPDRGDYVDCIDSEGVRVISLLWDQHTEEWLEFAGGGYSYNYFTHWIKSPANPPSEGE